MYTRTVTLVLVGLGVATAGCASQPPRTYEQHVADERNEERAEMIQDLEEDLQEVDTEIGRLETKLIHEKPYADQEEQVEWSHDLFELKQDRNEIRSTMQRAKTASDAEWEEMRGELGTSMDKLQAGVSNVGEEIADAFDDDGTAVEDNKPPHSVQPKNQLNP